MIGEVPVGIAGAGDVLGQALLFAAVERKVQAGEIQQAGLAATLRTDQQVPGQLAAPFLAAPAVEAGCLQGAQRLPEAMAQLLLLLADQAVAAQLLLNVLVLGVALFARTGAPAGEDHGQPPAEKQHADAQQAGGRGFPEPVVVDRQQRPDEPHHDRQQQDQQQAPDPGPAQHGAELAKERLHLISSLKRWNRRHPCPASGRVAARPRVVRRAPRRSRRKSPRDRPG